MVVVVAVVVVVVVMTMTAANLLVLLKASQSASGANGDLKSMPSSSDSQAFCRLSLKECIVDIPIGFEQAVRQFNRIGETFSGQYRNWRRK